MSLSARQHCHATAGYTKRFSHVEISIKPNPIEPEPESSNEPPSCDSTPPRQRRGHRWTLEQREAICILRRWYSNSWEELAQIFNAHFSTEEQSDESTPKVSLSALAAQLYEMQCYGLKREAFVSVFVETLFVDEFGAWSNTRRELEQTGRKVGIVLRRRLFEDKLDMLQKCDHRAKRMKRKRTMSGIDSVLGNLAYESEEERVIPKTPRKQQKYLTPSLTPQKGSDALTHVSRGQFDSVTAGGTQYKETPVTPQSLRQPSKTVISPLNRAPQEETRIAFKAAPLDDDDQRLGIRGQLPRTEIVFRFYDVKSSGTNGPIGIRAGLFPTSMGEIPLPPNIGSKSFRKEAIKHLSWTKEPTPFISMYESLLPVLHRGFQSPANAQASVAVINLHTISNSQAHDSSRLYHAAQIINQLGIRPQIYGYRGRSEWLVWGIIDKDAIVATFKIEQLRNFLAGSPDVCIVLRFPEIENSENAKEYRERLRGNANHVSRASGRVVGKFLAFIGTPPSYIDYAARKIARDWQLNGSTSSPRLRRYMEGVQLGLQSTRAELKPSTQVKGKQRLAKYLKQVDSGLQRKGAGDVPLKQPRANPGIMKHLQQVDAGLQRKKADNMLSKQERPKLRMTEYLRRLDSGLERKSAELTLPGQGHSRPRLASYPDRVDRGLRHAGDGVTDKCGVHIQSLKSQDFLLRRRHIEAVCQGR